MDAVMFHVKGAHLAVQRVGRGLLRRFGLTPARFDLMHALGSRGMKQNRLWRRLNVVRSVVCEMVRALQELSWVKRVRAADGRTWLVQLTQRGRRVLESAYSQRVESGDVTLTMDAALTRRHVELDAQKERTRFVLDCDALETEFARWSAVCGPDLYPWHPEDYYARLLAPGERTPPGGLPQVESLLD